MAYANETIALEDLSQADGNIVQNLIGEANFFQFSFNTSASATGTVGIMIQTHPDVDFEPLLNPDTGSQETIDLSDFTTTIVDGYKLRAVRFDPTSVVGSYSVYIQQENR